MMKPYRILILALGIVCVLSLTASADVPQLISYQGRLTDSTGTPVPDGDYDVRFEIWDSPVPSEADIMLWTSFTVTVAVSNGLFTHMLGSANPLPPSVFVYSGDLGRYLAIEVIGQGVTPPRKRMITVPWAYQAINADTAGYALTGGGGGGYWQPGLGGAGSIYYDGGNVGIGNSRPAHTLDVTGDINTSTLYRSNGATILKDLGSFSIALGIHAGESGTSGNSTFLGHNAGQFGSGLDNTYVGYSAGISATGESNVYVGSGSGSNATGTLNTFVGAFAAPNNQGNNNVMIGQAAGHWHTTGDNNTFVGTAAGNGNIIGERNTFIGKGAGQNATGSDNVFLGRGAGCSGDESHTLIINNTTAGTPLVYGNFLTNRLGVNIDDPESSLEVDGRITSSGNLAGFKFYDRGGSLINAWTWWANSSIARLQFNGLAYQDVLGITTTGNMGIGSIAPGDHRLYVESDGESVLGATSFFKNTNDNGIAIIAENTSDDATAVFLQKGSGDALRCFYIDSENIWNFLFRVTNTGRAICNELELLGGADLAEPFAMSGGEVPVGALVVIDDENPGKLKLSDRAYDTRVAGITSGAGGVKPGLTLSQKDVFEDGQNVAINGRVYCLADASYGVIKPGDLLTTSDTPGHAMRATDRGRAYGSVIGKAMSGLDDGQGLVLVLVNLQ